MSGFNARIMPTKYVNKLSSLPFHRQLITTIKCHLGIIIIKLRGEMSHMKFIVFWALKLCWPQQEERANFFFNASLFPFILVLRISHVEISNYQAWFVSAIAFLPGVTGYRVVFTIPCRLRGAEKETQALTFTKHCKRCKSRL